MCNLYDIGPSRRRSGGIWETAVESALAGLPRRHGIRKTDAGLVALLRRGGAEAEPMRWGFLRDYNPAVNNARSERLDGPWAAAWRERRRCLVPMSAWYEWRGPAGDKQTFAFEGADGAWVWAAGIWEEGASGPAYAVLTRPATEELAFVHDRMPALLDPASLDRYLREDDPRALLHAEPPAVKVARVRNPLLDPARHRGPEPIETLPGF